MQTGSMTGWFNSQSLRCVLLESFQLYDLDFMIREKNHVSGVGLRTVPVICKTAPGGNRRGESRTMIDSDHYLHLFLASAES